MKRGNMITKALIIFYLVVLTITTLYIERNVASIERMITATKE